MVRIEFKDERPSYSFELANAEREMNFCIDLSQCDSRGPARTFRITNKHGIVRLIKSDEVKKHTYTKTTPSLRREREQVPA